MPTTFHASKVLRSACALALCLCSEAALADAADADGSGLRFSGFGTLGIAHTEAPPGWGFLRDIEQPASDSSTRFDVDSRLGMQLNYAANSRFELVGQWLAMRRATYAPLADATEWAFAAYRPTADLTLRAGRLNLDQFVMSDYRSVGFAYLYVRPPVEYYGSIPTHLDGVDVTRTWNFEDSRWRAKGFVGSSKMTGIPLADAFGFSLARESDGLLLRAGWTRARLTHNSADLVPLLNGLDQLQSLPLPGIAGQAAALRSELDLAARPPVYVTLGMTYEQGPWQCAAEAARISLGTAVVRAGYASIGRRVGEFTWYGVVSGAASSEPSVPTPAWGAMLAPYIGPAAAQQAQALGAAAAYAASQTIRQSTFSLGARWDIQPRMAIKLQWDHVVVRANGGFLWSNASADPARATVASLVLDTLF